MLYSLVIVPEKAVLITISIGLLRVTPILVIIGININAATV
jgi:hypothetical protein